MMCLRRLIPKTALTFVKRSQNKWPSECWGCFVFWSINLQTTTCESSVTSLFGKLHFTITFLNHWHDGIWMEVSSLDVNISCVYNPVCPLWNQIPMECFVTQFLCTGVVSDLNWSTGKDFFLDIWTGLLYHSQWQGEYDRKWWMDSLVEHAEKGRGPFLC